MKKKTIMGENASLIFWIFSKMFPHRTVANENYPRMLRKFKNRFTVNFIITITTIVSSIANIRKDIWVETFKKALISDVLKIRMVEDSSDFWSFPPASSAQ